ncbi:hypothetical protein [Arenibacter troitsensis]|uniref:VIT family protein n=1 Tax=Arenibacter troitsensis TaxID=188872 RepID=A0A1X7K9Z0_9FLAO|nr:hypothetical protein [Arenibacter troitsensis]SMG37549.1 hypothetical protein SAMN03080602_02635 [Arenibacter troitsensis]
MRLYNQLLNEFKREQTGYSTIAIIGQSCIGSVAAMVVLMNPMPEAIKLTLLFLVTILCMAYNAAVLARLSSKTTFNLLVLSVIFSILTIVGILI